MICPKCNQFVADGSRFCTNCGNRLLDDEVQPAAAEYTQPEPADGFQDRDPVQPAATEYIQPDPADGFQDRAPEQPVTPGYTASQPYGEYQQASPVGDTVVKKGVSKPVIFGIIGGAVFLVAAIITLIVVFVVMGSKTRYNLQDYTVVEFSGIEGSGEATARIDSEKLTRDLAVNNDIEIGQLSNDNMDIGDIGDFFTGDTFAELFKLYTVIDSIKLELDKSEGLSNGDTVTVTYRFDPEKAKEFKAEFVGEPYTATVSGLEEIQEIDPFEDLEITFDGTSPNAFITIRNKATLNDAMRFIWFEVDKYDGYKLGDTVTVKVKGYEEETFLSMYGVKFSQLEKTYTVEGVEAYVTDNAPLDEAALTTMKQATEGYISEYFSDSGRAEYISASDVKYEGYYLLTNKADEVWYGYNKVYMIYSVNVKSIEDKKQFKPTKIYMPVEYTDLKINADGSPDVDVNYKMILGSTDLRFGFRETVSGYSKQEDMKSELIDAEAATYEGKVYGDGLAS